MESLKLVECPRDAMQGIVEFIPTELKAKYINAILKCGFDTVDFGSFVSQKSIPQLKDTAELLGMLQLNPMSKMLAIVANERGAMDACNFEEIDYLGFPFSVSEEFQQRNTNKSREDAFENIEQIYNDLKDSNKELVVYFSMAFGNPYHDNWNIKEIEQWTERFAKLGIKTLILSDTVGMANEKNIQSLFGNLLNDFPKIEFGAHFHTQYFDWKEKVEWAYNLGCRRFDGAIKGFGGCPMAKDELVGNMPTEHLISFMKEKEIHSNINEIEFQKSIDMANEIFATYH